MANVTEAFCEYAKAPEKKDIESLLDCTNPF
jgi:hypothetical protein